MNIRHATYNDLPAIRALHIANWRTHYRGVLPEAFLNSHIEPEMARKWNDDRIRNDLVIVAQLGSDVVGFAALETDDAAAYLDNLHVAEGLQGQGVGRSLMAAVLEAAIDQRASEFWLKVIVGNTAALRFYERLGGTVSTPFAETLMGVGIESQRVTWDDLPSLRALLSPK